MKIVKEIKTHFTPAQFFKWSLLSFLYIKTITKVKTSIKSPAKINCPVENIVFLFLRKANAKHNQ